ncbi:signal transduction histidine kinase [Deinobacterium chartae]|uniref:histidine kinase n=1 Tax=Deinobacterium chartae TaxID=521158 RepID=A0A841I3K4_9DEIO|nr:ATP-binding protein [Deinobacterium chartae]MBB6098602.1 signal transduction histidine kinase [Deinobacterium chartae]
MPSVPDGSDSSLISFDNSAAVPAPSAPLWIVDEQGQVLHQTAPESLGDLLDADLLEEFREALREALHSGRPVTLALRDPARLDITPLRSVLGSVPAALVRQAPDPHAVAHLEERVRALEAFVSFAESAGTDTDVYVLARWALQVLNNFFRDCSAALYELQGDRWIARVWTEDIRSDTLATITAGFERDTPVFAAATQSGEPAFVDAWDPERERIAHTEEYGTAGLYPLQVDGKLRGLLAVGLKDTQRWSERDKAVVRAVGRSLTLALERAEVAARLEAQRAELAVRNQALEAFTELFSGISLQSDPYTLVRRAGEIMMPLLPEGYLIYFELEGQTWRARVQVGDLGNSGLQAAVDAGLPYQDLRNLMIPWTTRQPFYQDVYDIDTDNLGEMVSHVGASAVLPLIVRDQVFGVIAVGLFHQRTWTSVDRVVLETVTRCLGLLIEGAQGVDRLAQRTAELERSNAELEQFAYVASHDLQEPLRTITSFSQLLVSRYSGQLDPRAEQYMQFIREGTERMGRLIRDLLAFSRVAAEPAPTEAVNTAELVAQVVRDLEVQIHELQASVTVGDLPPVEADATQFRQVLQNLLMNGLKFRVPDRPPRVEVTAVREGGWVRFAVKDNGIGIEEQYFDKIFALFQRLHTRDRYEGSGIGLSMARKIVERHGGRMWLESQLGKGTTFYFTMPAVGQGGGRSGLSRSSGRKTP